MDIAIPVDSRVREKEFAKIDKSYDLKWEILECEKCARSIVCCRGSWMCY